MTLQEKIINIRVELQNSKIKKSGKNKHAGFSYYELSDFLPTLNELMLKHRVNDVISLHNESAMLALVNAENTEEVSHYTIPFQMFDVPKTAKGSPMMQQIQYLGALNTYIKRYLYLNAFGITDGEVIDGMDNTQLGKEESASLQLQKLENLYNQKKERMEESVRTRAEEVIANQENAAYNKMINYLEKL